MVIVDSSVWIDFFNGKDAKERLILHNLINNEEDVTITGLILTEVLQGIKEDKDFNYVKHHLLQFPIIETSKNTYILSADIYRTCRKNGKTIRKTIDCLIAAVCIENNAILLHRDNDFNAIAECINLEIYNS